MSNQIQIKVAELNQLNPLMIADDSRVEQKFILMYNAIWGTGQGTQIYEKEKFNFRKILQDKPELQRCSPLSLYGCFLDIAVNGLSLDPTGRPHCYILPHSTKTGYKDNNGNDIYELRAYLSITGYGELVMRQRAEQVRYVDNPVVCYEGDTFSPGLVDGVKTVTYQAACPRKSNKVIGGFIRIVRADGTVDWHWMMEGDIKRLEAYSYKNNQRWNPQTRQKEGKANALYTSNEGGIDPGFLESKLIKHAFDGYPKVRTGKFTVFETQEEPQDIDYGLEQTTVIQPNQPGLQPQALQPQSENPLQEFGEQPQAEPVPASGITTPISQEDEDAGF